MSEAGVALVAGSSGGIGRALAEALVRSGRYGAVVAASRGGVSIEGAVAAAFDFADESTIVSLAGRVSALGPLRLAIVATGALAIDGVGPEKSWRELDAERLVAAFRLNAVGPALLMKHLLPLLPRRGRAVVAAISARVGSIGDNRLGGWYGYRASKAALNQIVRTAAIELSRTRPEAICVALHPGTVATRLSSPFRAGVPAERLKQPAEAAAALLAVLDGLGPAETGRFFAWDGSPIPF